MVMWAGSHVPSSHTTVLPSCVSGTVSDENTPDQRHWETVSSVRSTVCVCVCVLTLFCMLRFAIGTVTRATTVKVLECSRQFQCSRCHQVVSVTSDLEQYNTIPKPQRYA